MSNYKFNSHSIDLTIKYKAALYDLPKFNLHLLKMFTEEGFNGILEALYLNDEKLLEIWWYFLQKSGHFTTFDETLELLDKDSGGLDTFREALWEEIIAFCPAPKREGAKIVKEKMANHLMEVLKSNLSEPKS